MGGYGGSGDSRTIDGADAADESETIAVPYYEAERVLPLLAAEVVSPEVETTGCRHGGC